MVDQGQLDNLIVELGRSIIDLCRTAGREEAARHFKAGLDSLVAESAALREALDEINTRLDSELKHQRPSE
jgi:hypothetical protein